MGCTPSAPSPAPDELSQIFGPPPPIPVDIGSGIRHQLHNDIIVVFIFGGPASQKGQVIQELTTSFNFTSISIEDIVFNYLPSRVANMVDSIGGIQDILKRDQGILTVDWVLSMISAKLSGSMNQRFVIDIVPTLASIMKAESFKGRSHERNMENFERRHPITFALNICVADEQTLIAPKEEANGKDGKNLSPEMNQFMKGIDDVDKGRIEKRLDEYHQCAEPFLRYFQKSRRIVRLSILTGSFSNVITTVRDILLDFGFTMTRRDDNIVAFTTEYSNEKIDLEYYKMKVIHAKEICSSSDSLQTQISTIHKYISSHSRHDDNFLVVVPGFKNQDSAKGKRINFMEKKKEVYLDDFIKNKRHEKPPKERVPITVNCISSSRQILLFFEPFPTNLAQNISLIYNRVKDSSISSTSSDNS